MAISQERISGRIREIEERLEDHDESIDAIFEAIAQLITPPEKQKKQIGFEIKEPKTMYGKEANRKH